MLKPTIPVNVNKIGSKIGRPMSGNICPRCGSLGSRIVSRWVLNDRKQRYEPYYYVGHSISKEGRFVISWCYIRKKIAEDIISNPEKLKKYNMEGYDYGRS